MPITTSVQKSKRVFSRKAGGVQDVTTIVLAGGRGTRIQAIHPETPKPLVHILGRPFLYWLTTYLAGFGLNQFVYSTGYRAEQIEAWCAIEDFPELERFTCIEATPLGTGGGVLNCILKAREWVLVVNGDGLMMSGIPELLALRKDPAISGGLLGVDVPDTARYGSLSLNEAGHLASLREKVPGSGLINGGVYLFRTSILRALGQARPLSMERDVIPRLIATGEKLAVIPLGESPFIDIGTPETLAEAEEFVRAHLGTWPRPT